MTSKIVTKKLSSGADIPVIGLGTFLSTDKEQLENAVKAAVEAGYRHFDCAFIYQNEETVGKALKEIIDSSNGQLKREDFFITSKCWNTFHSKEGVHKCLDTILNSLGSDYLDLVIF
jgi:diketogulonate reductase-like aldo/keto reductase